MADGSGVPFLQPSIKGSAWIANPDPQLLLSLILRGSAILGDASQAYENDMAPQEHLTDAEIAAVAKPERGLRLAGGTAAGLRLLDAAGHAALVGADRGRQARHVVVIVLDLVIIEILGVDVRILADRTRLATAQARLAVMQGRAVLILAVAGEEGADAAEDAADGLGRLGASPGHDAAAVIEPLGGKPGGGGSAEAEARTASRR